MGHFFALLDPDRFLIRIHYIRIQYGSGSEALLLLILGFLFYILFISNLMAGQCAGMKLTIPC
jgi:hypothetical protein